MSAQGGRGRDIKLEPGIEAKDSGSEPKARQSPDRINKVLPPPFQSPPPGPPTPPPGLIKSAVPRFRVIKDLCLLEGQS